MVGQVTLKRTLGLGAVVLFGLAFMAPMIVLGTFGPLAEASRGTAAMSYLLAGIGICLTAISYAMMARIFPVAGSSYSYARKALGANIGFLVGWAMLLDYFFISMVIWLIGAAYLASAWPSVPMWAWIAAFSGVTTLINVLGIVLASRVNLVLMIVQVTVLAVFVLLAGRAVVVANGPGGLASLTPFITAGVPFSASVAGATIAAYAFLGFDVVSTLTEETFDPVRVMPKAVMIVALAGAGIFIISAYVTQLAHPGFQFADIDTGAFEIARAIGGDLFASLFLATLVITQFTGGVAAQAGVGRFLFAMGRDGVLPPSLFARLHPKWHTPVINLVLVGLVGFIAMGMDITTSTSFINFGAFLAFTAVNLSVIVLYAKNMPVVRAQGILVGVVVPAVGALFDLYLLSNLDSNAQILGIIWLSLGLLYLLYLTRLFRRRAPDLHFEEEPVGG